MPRPLLSQRRMFTFALACSTIFAAGVAVGIAVRLDFLEPESGPFTWLQEVLHPAEHVDDHHEDEPEEDHEGVVHLTTQAVKNLDLRLGPVRRTDYMQYLRIPAEVMEKTGSSNHSLAAPVNGVVTQLFITPGQAVKPGEAMFNLRVTDEALTDAQLSLLDVLSRIDVIDADLARLEPLVEAGTISGRRHLDLRYERQQLDARQKVRIQELLIRGLDQKQVDSIIGQKTLIREFTIHLPITDPPAEEAPDSLRHQPQATLSSYRDGDSSRESESLIEEYTVEDLDAHPGKTVQRGQTLCHLAYHRVLYIKGQAYEDEIDDVIGVKHDHPEWSIHVEFGIDGREIVRKDLSIHYIDNHVDEKTQTFAFYVPLANELIRETTDASGRRFQTWRFRPGQRAHIQIPIRQFRKILKVPVEAIVQEGADVFLYHIHDHTHSDDEPDAHDHEEIEFERVPVHVLYQDSRFALLADDGSVLPGEQIALNAAYQLNLALKLQSSGGGGHHHHHDH